MQNYEYPIDTSWTHEEMGQVVNLWNAVEAAYERGIDKEEFLDRYRAFKKVIPSKGEEKRYGQLFEKRSGCSLYQVVKTAASTEKMRIKITK